MNDRFTVEPVSVDTFRRGMNGKRVLITADVGNVAKKLKEIDPALCIDIAEATGHFIIYREVGNSQELVFTAKELDDRIVNRCQYINSHHYDYTEEVMKADEEAWKAKESALSEETGLLAEELSFALRKDLGYNKDANRSKQSWGKK